MRVETFVINRSDSSVDLSERPFLTVIVPVFNEERTIGEVLTRLVDGPYPFPGKEIIVVDDGSTDSTAKILEAWRDVPGLAHLRHAQNRGKGASIRTGLKAARGRITIIQDADLEYDPWDIPKLVEIIVRNESDVAFGSRYLLSAKTHSWTRFRLAVSLLNWLVLILYGHRLSDEATCYKAFRTYQLRDMNLECRRFEFCPEVTAKACRMGLKIVEVPISYTPRTTDEGKKIRLRDAWEAVWTLIRWRVARVHV